MISSSLDMDDVCEGSDKNTVFRWFSARLKYLQCISN